ncbi:MAG: hypothetical protein KBA66_24060 [Leptospiraceae bacterium]|nr:hypothetical protein [Leptospiraceae bacterium]
MSFSFQNNLRTCPINILALFFFISCNSTWNWSGRYYKPINPIFENNEWKIVIKEMNESEENEHGIRSVKIKFTFQNKSPKYRMLKLMGGAKFTEKNLDFMVNDSNKNGIGDIYRKDPNLVDAEHLYSMEGLSLVLISKLNESKETRPISKSVKDNSKLATSCHGSDSGYGNRSPNTGSKWLAPNETGEEYINCYYPQGTQPVRFSSRGDFEIDLVPEIFYHEKVLKKFEGAL